jgi:hypothetical protein
MVTTGLQIITKIFENTVMKYEIYVTDGHLNDFGFLGFSEVMCNPQIL